jgi:hypothetical protein
LGVDLIRMHVEDDLVIEHCPDRLVRDVCIIAARAGDTEVLVTSLGHPSYRLCASPDYLHPGSHLHAAKGHECTSLLGACLPISIRSND